MSIKSWVRPGTRREFVRACLESGEEGTVRVVLFPRQGADVLTSAVWGEGLVEIPEGTTVPAAFQGATGQETAFEIPTHARHGV